MSIKSWKAAVVKYHARKAARDLKLSVKNSRNRELIEKRRKKYDEGIRSETVLLKKFSDTEEWDAAISLLRASDNVIIFGAIDSDEIPHTEFYFICKHGFRKCYLPTGTKLEHAFSLMPVSQLLLVSASDVVQAAVLYGMKKPSEVVTWLKNKLDKIALAVNK
jgi:hypothetical protein